MVSNRQNKVRRAQWNIPITISMKVTAVANNMIPELTIPYSGDSTDGSDDESERWGKIDLTDHHSAQIITKHANTKGGGLKDDRPYTCIEMSSFGEQVKTKVQKKRSRRKKNWKVASRKAMKHFLAGNGGSKNT